MYKIMEKAISAFVTFLQKIISLFFLGISSAFDLDSFTPNIDYFNNTMLNGHMSDVMKVFATIAVVMLIFLLGINVTLILLSGFTDNKDTCVSLFMRSSLCAIAIALGPLFLGAILDQGNQFLAYSESKFGDGVENAGVLTAGDKKTEDSEDLKSILEASYNLQSTSFVTAEQYEQMAHKAGIDVDTYNGLVAETEKWTDFASKWTGWLGAYATKKYAESKIEEYTGVDANIMYDNYAWNCFSGLIGCLLFGVVAYFYMKLIVELIRRYITIMILYLLNSPANTLFCCAATTNSWLSYYKMFGCETFIFVMTKIWLVLSIFMMSHVQNTLFTMFAMIAFMQFGIKMEQAFKEIGLTASSTGAALLDNVALTAGIMAHSLSGARQSAGKGMINFGSAAGNISAVSMGSALTGRPLSPAGLNQTMQNNPFGRMRMGLTSGSANSNATGGIKKNAANMLKEGGLFRNAGFNEALNGLNASGKKDMLNSIGNNMFSGLKDSYAKNGLGFDLTGYDNNKGLGFNVTDKNGNVLNSGFITDSMPKDGSTGSFEVMGNDGKRMFANVSPIEDGSVPRDTNEDGTYIAAGDYEYANGVATDIPQQFDTDSSAPLTAFEASAGLKMNADMITRDSNGNLDMNSTHYQGKVDRANGYITLSHNSNGDPQTLYSPYAAINLNSGRMYRKPSENALKGASTLPVIENEIKSRLTGSGYSFKDRTTKNFTNGSYAINCTSPDGIEGRMLIKNAFMNEEERTKKTSYFGATLGDCTSSFQFKKRNDNFQN